MTWPTAGLVFPTGYAASTSGGGSQGISVALTYASNGDTNGLIYYLGSNAGVQAFANPIPSQLVGLMSSNVNDDPGYETYLGYGVERTTNRSDGLPAHTANVANSWIGFRLPANRTININVYTLKNRSDFNACPTAWALEVSNNIQENTVAGWNAATWTIIDSRSGQNFGVGEWKNYTASGVSCNAWRWRQTAVTANNSFGNTNHFVLGEVEVYGTLTTISGGGSSLEPETTALLARFTGTYSQAAQTKIDTFIKAGKTDGWYTKLDGLWVPGFAANDADSRLNVISASYPLTGGTFVSGKGLRTNGAVVNTGYTVLTAGIKYTRNDAHYGVFLDQNLTAGNAPEAQNRIAGTFQNGVLVSLIYANLADLGYATINTTGNATYTNHAVVTRGFLQVNRLSSASFASDFDGQVLTGNHPSVALANLPYRIAEFGWDGIFSAATVGAGLTTAQAASLRTALNVLFAPSLEPETTALLARFTGTYSQAAQTKIDTFIKAGKTDGWYQKLDGLWVVKSPTQSDALLNWISTSYPLVLEAGCTFTANSKIALQNVPGTSASVSTNYDPVAIGASAKYKQNDAFIGLYIQDKDPTNDEDIIVTASGITTILLDSAANSTQMVLNANTGNVTVASSAVPNLYQVSRENTTLRGHIGTTTANTTLASAGLGGGAFKIRETGSFKAVAVGGALTAAQAISFKNALEAYLA